MTNNTFIEYAKANGLTPLAWFEVDYPAYAVKVKYKYPTSDPADFRDRALLQMIDLGMPYPTACSILMVTDPHQTILSRFTSDDPGPQLVHFDKKLNRLGLTPMGKQRVERIELARDGVACCFIDGFTGHPYPIDVANNLKYGYDCKEVYNIPGGIYPFAPNIEQLVAEINAKITDGKGRNYQKRLGIPENALETNITPLGPKWMSNLSIGVFLKGNEIVRKIFCDEKANEISPFGWLENINDFSLNTDSKRQQFFYEKCKSHSTNVLINNSLDLSGLILSAIEKEYGKGFVNGISLTFNQDTSQFRIVINGIDGITRNRSKVLSVIDSGIMPISLTGITGSLFVEVTSSESINKLGHLRKKISKSEHDWHKIIEMVRREYPDNWRQTLIAIDRHDIVFRHDIEQYIKYGK